MMVDADALEEILKRVTYRLTIGKHTKGKLIWQAKLSHKKGETYTSYCSCEVGIPKKVLVDAKKKKSKKKSKK